MSVTAPSFVVPRIELGASVTGTGQPPADQFKGWLYKWTNYIRGYQKRWFVLQNGLLSYYRFVKCKTEYRIYC